MRQLFAVALVAGLMAAPACAQHGGGGHGGGGGFHGGGGFSGHAGFSSPGGFAHAGGYGGGYRAAYGGGAFAPRYGVQGRAFGGGVGVPHVSNGRPAFYHRGGDRRRGYGNGLGYGWYGPLDYGWLDADDTEYGDPDSAGYGYGGYDVGPYDDGSGVGPDGYGANGYGAPGPDPEGPGYDTPPIPYTAEYAEPEPRPGAPITVTAGPLYNNDAVTLVFKDGRAPEKIHNYALTRTMVYVTDGRSQEIPVAALDLAATEQANRAAGVDFQLPTAQ